jgi:hypothetical protein
MSFGSDSRVEDLLLSKGVVLQKESKYFFYFFVVTKFERRFGVMIHKMKGNHFCNCENLEEISLYGVNEPHYCYHIKACLAWLKEKGAAI